MYRNRLYMPSPLLVTKGLKIFCGKKNCQFAGKAVSSSSTLQNTPCCGYERTVGCTPPAITTFVFSIIRKADLSPHVLRFHLLPS